MRITATAMLGSLTLLAAGAPEAQVDAIFAAYSAPGSPGCAVGVLQKGSTVLAKGYGFADLEQRVRITPRTRFYMASVSKQFTSFSLLLAEQEGKLKLDDSIRKHIPELPDYTEPITIRRMLDHTAGLRDYLALWQMRGFSNESVLTEAPTLALVARQKALNFAPGTDYSYSNTGYLLAAVALRRATGKSLSDYSRTHIFAPLEMQSTRFQHDHGEPVPDRAHGYVSRDGWKTADLGFDLIGSGGLYSNIDDMLKWARNFHSPVAGAPLLKPLQTPGKLVDGRPTPGGYALGLIEKDGAYSHSGGATGYSTFFLRLPAKDLSIVCLCNIGRAPAERLARQVAAVFSGIAVDTPSTPERADEPVAITARDAAALAGEYWSEELHSVWRLTAKENRVYLQNDGGEFELSPRAGRRFAGPNFEFQAVGDAPGPVRSLQASAGRARGISFVRR